MGELINVEGGVAGERPTTGTPLPNRTDAVFAELDALRAEAAELGLDGADRLPLAELRPLVEQARAARG
jgi:hypothetical protein